MKMPWAVAAAGGICALLALVSAVVVLFWAAYIPLEQRLEAAAEAVPFLPPMLTMLLGVLIGLMPGAAAFGIFSGKKWAVWLMAAFAAADIGLRLAGEFTLAQIVVPLLYNGIPLALLSTPSARAYFKANA